MRLGIMALNDHRGVADTIVEVHRVSGGPGIA
jgi:hypothetical protein